MYGISALAVADPASGPVPANPSLAKFFVQTCGFVRVYAAAVDVNYSQLKVMKLVIV